MGLLCLALLPVSGQIDAAGQVPDAKFQGRWEVKQHFFRGLQEGVTDFDNLGEVSPKGEVSSHLEVVFRRHKSGAIQQVWTDSAGTVVESKGITLLNVTSNTLTYKAWSDHPTWKTILTVKADGSAVFQVRSLKHQETFILVKPRQAKSTEQRTQGEQTDPDNRRSAGG